MIEHDHDARRVSDADQNKTAETVIGVGKLIYRSCTQSPEILAFDPPTLWLVLHESYVNDAEARWLLADVNALARHDRWRQGCAPRETVGITV